MKKSMNLDEFLKAMNENNSKNAEEFLEKLFNIPTTKEGMMEKTKEILHREIDELKTEKDFERYCLKIAEIVLQHYKNKIIGDK